jgi:hypothetical protein
MDQQQLIAETNELLKRILDLEAERKVEAEQARVEAEKSMKDFDLGMGRIGSPGSLVENDHADWEKRFAETQKKSRERIDAATEKDREYKADLLGELAIQTALLRQIAEKLKR